jgi:hypothetical protein
MSVPQDWVAKIHPATRGAEPEDPMELVAAPVQGDPEVMLQCLVQEFAWMGWDAEQLLGLFHSPAYPVLQQMLACYGEAVVRERVEALLGRSGVFRVREVVAEDPGPEADEPELIQLTIRVPERE